MANLHPETKALLERLALAPHPEGGFYRETWRSPARVATPRGERSALTVIHYLLPAGSFSAFHRVHADEVWQHAGGDPLELHVLDPAGAYEVHRMGAAGPGAAVPHVVVPAGHWQAARPLGARHVLASCSVAPGFDFDDFEMARHEELALLRPDLAALIRSLCRPSPDAG
jgi:predicted cupin superfamily sugar epimerase